MDPIHAQTIVAEYGRVLTEHAEQDVYPTSVASLPHPKLVIQEAIATCVGCLATSGQLTDELKSFLEVAYVSLADYVDDEIVRLVREFREAAGAVAHVDAAPEDRRRSPAWQRMQASGKLAGEIARAIAEDTQKLRREFLQHLEQCESAGNSRV
jgi:hypothetical protein